MKYPNLEIIAIHIKKTGGRSFQALLENQYPGAYYRFNAQRFEKHRDRLVRRGLKEMPADTKALHGHFFYRDIQKLVKAKPDVPLVTWLRDPVQRVISSYYFTRMKFDIGVAEKATKINQRTLLEFAKQQSGVEPMWYVLDGIDLKDMQFVGVLERLDEDLPYLIGMMGWKEFKFPKENANTDYKAKFPPPTEDEIAKLRKLYQRDIELYNYALELQENRPSEPVLVKSPSKGEEI